MSSPHCKFCDQPKPLIKAHIIPEAFFPKNSARLLSSLPDVYPKRAHIGVYDTGILCAECDGSFGFLDQHVMEHVLRDTGQFIFDGEFGLRRYPTASPTLVRLFALSVVWRAHHSSHSMFANVNLGHHEAIIKQDLLNPLDHAVVSAMVHEFNEPNPPTLSPIPERYDTVRFMRLYAGRLVFSVKVDKRPMPEALRELDLLNTTETRSIVVPWLGSAEADLSVEIVTGSRANLQLANKWRREGWRDPLSVFRLAAGKRKHPS